MKKSEYDIQAEAFMAAHSVTMTAQYLGHFPRLGEWSTINIKRGDKAMPNIIDTRDLNKRLEELESELEDLQEAVADAEEALEECEEGEHHEPFVALNEATAELEDWQEENQEELEELRALRDEIPDWRHGETLINDDYFVEYAQELAEDLNGAQTNDWPYSYIDWDRAADALKMDYSSCEYQGETYWFRG